MGKVTERIVKYPHSFEPDYIIPSSYQPYRYVLGKKGKKILGIVGMNPSAANERTSDNTVNIAINVAKKLGYDGYMMFNMYPERGTSPKSLKGFDMYLHKENLKYIKETIKTFNIKEVWVCWGDNIIKEAKYDMVKMLRLQNIFMFTFWELTKKNNPSHPLYKSYKDIDSSKRRDYYWQKEKILILGDSHGEKDIIEQIRFKENPDLIIHTGDIYNFDTKRSEIENEWIETNIDYLTLGNHDINAKTPQDFNSSEEYDKYMYDLDPYYLLKNKYTLFFIQNYNVLLTHSFEYEPNYATWYNKFKPRQNQNEEDWNIHFSKIITSVNIKLVICGHTHIPYIKEKKDLIILNPGALSGKNKTYIIGTYNKKKEEFSFKIKTWQ